MCVSEAVAANKLLRQSWLNLPLSEAIFFHYCLPRTTPNPLSTPCLPFTACFKPHLLQEKLSELTSLRMNHFPSHSIVFNHCSQSIHQLGQLFIFKFIVLAQLWTPERHEPYFPLCFLQSCNIVLSILHMLYKCLLNDRLLCQEKQNLRKGNGRVVSPVLTYMWVPIIFVCGKRTMREAIDLQWNARLGGWAKNQGNEQTSGSQVLRFYS